MNPYQHGEVFVTEDGAETDLDLGHYERFTDEDLTRDSSVTSGKIYWSGPQPRAGGGLPGGHGPGDPPHHRRDQGAHLPGGPPGGGGRGHHRDRRHGGRHRVPALPEAIRQVAAEVGRRNVLYLHVSLIVSIPGTGELKSKPTQHSVKELLSLGTPAGCDPLPGRWGHPRGGTGQDRPVLQRAGGARHSQRDRPAPL